MYERSALVSGAMAICYLIQIAGALAFFLSSNANFIVVAAPLARRTRCVIQKVPKHVWVTWVCIMAFEAVLFLLALYKAVLHLSRFQYRWRTEIVTEVLLRDSFGVHNIPVDHHFPIRSPVRRVTNHGELLGHNDLYSGFLPRPEHPPGLPPASDVP
ncbi:hypothetical protein JAAARDRAFT_192479 [Jaapia argillacea MUCL 33604]|uniref:Uncharacterized protein n=1 Tax=Jaapia argillacea MUCL 33604 TaxID=933084 RepID=A0A067PYF7_9AGAM|nr:hypothetical protein JAAARDRAFT_192479 [Jaapia argillacea MUCL 33604]